MVVTDIVKILATIAAIVMVAVLIYRMDTPSVSQKIEKVQEKAEPTNAREEAIAGDNGCLEQYGISQDTVVFAHSDYCLHCRNMVPIVNQLENEGYKFYWAENSDPKAAEVMQKCFSSLLSGYVPEFICLRNNAKKTGEISEEELRIFARQCRQEDLKR